MVLVFAAAALAADNPSPSVSAYITKDLHVKRLKVGDKFFAKTNQILILKDGTKLKEGTKLVGRITVVTAKDKETPSKLGMVFDKVLVNNQEVPISLVMVAVGKPALVKGADSLAAGNTGMNSWGRMSGSSSGSGTGAGANGDPASGALKGGLGNSSMGEKDADLQAGVSQLDNIKLKSMASADPGTILESKDNVLVDANARILLVVPQE
jgi:hypothetical protein